MNKRVMIMEDNESILQMLSEIVRAIDSKIEVFEFSSLEHAYDVALENTIDVFLVDIILDSEDRSDISGLHFIERIRAVAKYEFTPVIFITALEDPKFHAYSELHSFSYLEKPFRTEQVRRVVEKALRFPRASQKDKTLFFRKEGILYSVKCSEILYIENIKHQVHFHRVNGESFTIPYKALKQIMEEAEDSELLQCNRNMIINSEYIYSIDIINRFIMLKGIEKPINIGRTHLKKVSRLFNLK